MSMVVSVCSWCSAAVEGPIDAGLTSGVSGCIVTPNHQPGMSWKPRRLCVNP
jgi:hypothetical protein